MASLGTVYLKLINELQVVHNSKVDITCNMLSFVPDLQSLLEELFPINAHSHSVVLSKLSILKLFLELVLSAPKSTTLMKIFDKVFVPGFLDSLITQDQLSSKPTVTYLISELTALFLFASHKLGVTAHLNHQSTTSYLAHRFSSTKMKLQVVKILGKLQKQYNCDTFVKMYSDVFGTLIWNCDIISTIDQYRVFFVKLCLDVLSSNAADEIRSIMLQDFPILLDFLRLVDSIDVKSHVCLFLNELFSCHGYEYKEKDLMTRAAGQILAVLRETDFSLLHDVDKSIACIAVLRISLWILVERFSSFCGKNNVEDVLEALKRFESTAEELIRLFMEEDRELIDFLMLHLDLSWIMYNNGMSETICCPLIRIKPWDLFLELMLKLTFDETVLNDWLISNETHFLRYFVKLCKILRLFWSEFNHACAEMNGTQRVQEKLDSLGTGTLLDACMSTVIRLKLKIIRLHSASLYPYSPEPLIKLLTSLENLYEYE